MNMAFLYHSIGQVSDRTAVLHATRPIRSYTWDSIPGNQENVLFCSSEFRAIFPCFPLRTEFLNPETLVVMAVHVWRQNKDGVNHYW